jgi:hypothetical protein
MAGLIALMARKLMSITKTLPLREDADAIVRSGQATTSDENGLFMIEREDVGDTVAVKAKEDLSTTNDELKATSLSPQIVNKDVEDQSSNTNEAVDKKILRKHWWQLIQAGIMHTTVLLLAHHVGLLVVDLVRNSKHIGEQILAVVGLCIATFLAFCQ